ncbi:isopeptide-forming domain-containing fimbrial protein [Lysobacter enzymogenes]|nr:isopeptide-forming domain-containing fimbrial protein [Lysobacter enzymogenes]QCW24928.1 isopeptide-forming domain-containing fimbrial protein [Lysobacter enzymogenes]
MLLSGAGSALAQNAINNASVAPPAGVRNTGAACAQAGGVFDNATGTCTATDSDPIVSPEITSSKSSTPATGTTVNPGDTITYALSTTITTAALTQVYTLTDTLSGDQTFGSVTNAGAYTCTGTGPVVCTLPAGTAPGTYTLTYTTTVDDDASGTVGNSVAGTGGGDPDPECTNCTTTHPVALPVITSSKSSTPATGTTVNPGDTITYTLSTTITTAALTQIYTLTDTLSGDQTFGSVTNAGAYTCTGTGPVVCTLPAGTVPGTYTLTYTTTVDADASGTVGNSVAGTGGGDPDPECTNCTTTHPVALPVITSSKSSTPATGTTVNPGETITYTLSTTITTAALTQVYTLTDTLSGDQTFGSVTNAGAYTCTGTGPVVCTLPAGTAPGTYTLTYTTTVDDDASGTVGNSVAGTGGGDPDPECSNCTTTHPVALPVITSSKSSTPATGTTVNPGDTITYTLSTTITTAALTQVYTLTDTLSGDQTFGSVTNAGAYTCTGTGPVVCTLPAGTAPGTYTLTYTTTVDADASGTVGNSVAGTGGGDPDPECTNCTTTHPVALPVITSSKSSTPATGTTVNPGDTITYTLSTTITTAALTQVYTLTDTLSGDQTFGSVTNAGAYTCTGTGPVVCTLPAGTATGTYTLTYTTTVDDDASGTVGNSVTGTGGGDPDPECTNCTTTHPVALPVITSSKSSAPATGTTVNPGDTITYTLSTTITTAALTQVYTLTDTLSGDQTFGSVTNAGAYTCTGTGPVVCTLPAGTAPGTYTLTYTTTVDADASGTVGNSVAGTGGGDPDPECSNCTTTHPVALPVITSSKSSNPATGTTVNPGDTITYTLSTTITTAALTQVYTLTDTLSGDQTFGSVTNAGAYTCNAGGPLSCTLPAGTAPGTYTLTYTTTVDADASGTVGNSVAGTGGGDPDPECTNCTTTHPVALPVITSSKSSTPTTGTTVNPGDMITYTLSTTIATAALTQVYTLTDTLSGDQTFGSVTNAGAYTCNAGAPLACTLPAGTATGTYTLTYTTTVDADASGTVGNSVAGTGGGDPDPECSNCTTTHPVALPVITSSKSSTPATGTTVNPGDTITYTLSTTITTAALTQVYTLTDTLSGDQTFGSVTNAGAYTCNAGGPLSCTLPAGTAPGTYTLTYTTTVDDDASGTVGNSVAGTGGGDPDPECSNCTTTHPVALPVITSSKSSTPATGTTVNPGETITYTLSTTITTAALTQVYTLTDTLSGDQTFGSVTNAGAYTCTGTGPVACTLPVGTAPGTYTLTYTTTVDADASGTVGNSVTGTGGGDPDPECTNCTTTHPVALPVITSSKSSTPATGTTVNPGDTITYTLSTTITTAALTQVYTLTDTLSGDQTFGSVTNAGAYTCTGTGPVVCTLPAGTVPGTYPLTYTTTVDADASGTVGNSVAGTGGGDPDPECSNCTTTHPVALPVITSSKSSTPATGTTVNPGDTITYTLSTTITTAALTQVYTLTDTLSGDQTFGSVTNAGAYTCTGTGPVVCTLPAGTAPGTYTLTYTTTVDDDASGTVGNSVAGTGGGDPDPECSNCTTTHPVALPVITSSKSSTPATGTTVNPGDTITYTLSTTITTAALTQVYTLTDTLSGDQTFGSVTNAGAYTCNTGGPLACTLPAGTAPGTYTLTYTTTVDADASGTVGNSVAGTGGGDPDPECTNCTTTHPVALPVITSSKSSTPATGTTVNPGDTITYTLSTTITTAALTQVYTLTDTLSGDQTFGSVTNAGAYTCNTGGPLACTLPAGTAPGTYTLTYTTTVDADASGTVGNSVAGTGGGDPDPECSNCTTTHPVALPVITSSKSSTPATGTTVNPGDTITYTLSTTITTAALTQVYTLTDTLSGDQTFGSVTNAGAYTCTGTGPVVCTLPAGTVPGTYTLTYTTTVDADASGTVGNSVAGTGGGDPDPECTNCTTTHPVALPVITSSKSSTPATGTTVNPGDTITYTLSTTIATAALTQVYTLTDTLSGDQTFGSVTNAGAYTCTGTGPVVCTLPAGTVPGTYTLTYTTTVDADASGTVGNSVAGTGGGDPDPECSNCTTTHPVALPVITSSKSSTPTTGTTVNPGDTITYTLSTTIATAALTQVYTLTDTLSGDQTFGSVTNAGAYTCNAGGPLVCTLPAGTAPGTYTLTYTTTVDADASGTVGNSVAGTGGGDPDPECSNCTTTHPVALPVITSSKSSTPATGTTVNPGDTITYTLSTTITTAALTQVYTLTDTLSGDQTFGSVTNAGAYTCNAGGPLVCTLPAGTAPGTYTLTYTTTVDADASGTVGNSVAGTGGGDPDPECTNCTTTHPVALPVITSSKSSTPTTGTTVNPGDTITYTLSTTITTAALTQVYTLTDTLSGDQTFGSVTNAGAYTCTGTLSCTLPAGTAPGTYTLTYTTTVDADASGTVGNSVAGTGGGDPDPECTNCTTTHPVALPVITSSKSSTPATGTTVNPGDTITYTLSTTITTAALTQVYTLTDTLSGDQTFGSVTNAGAYTCTGTGPVVCTLPAGTVPGTYTLTYTTTVDADASGTVGNSVAGTGGGDPDPECTNCTTTHPVALPVITSSKSSTPATGTTVNPGDTITYTLSTTITTAALTQVYTLTDTLSGDQTFGSVTNAGAYTCTGTGPVVCTLPAGTVPGTYTLTYTTTVDADASGTVGNSVAGTGGGDPDPECTNCTTTHPVALPVITSSKSSTPATGTTVNPGDTITYTLSTTVTTAALTQVYTLTDTLSGDQTFGSVTNAGAYTCTGTGPVVCTLPAGTAPGTYTLTYTTTVDADASGTVGNSVTGTGGGDPDPECTNCTTTHPVALPVITSSKSSTPATGTTVNPGETITYTLSTTITTAALTQVYTLTDTLSGDQTFGSVTNAGAYTCTGTGPVVCTLPAGTAPGTYTLTYTTTVDDNASGTVGNSVAGTGGGDPDPECTNCTTTHPVALPVITSSKSSTPATGTTVNPGETITYTLSTTIATAALTQVYTLTDTLSGDQTFGSVTNAGAYTCNAGGPLSCTLPAGTAPGTYTLTYTTTVDADASGTVGNSVAGAGGGDPDPECTNCTTTHPVALPVITSSKSSTPATGTTVNPGDTITYTLSTTITTAALTQVYTLTDTLSGDQTFGSVTNAGAYTCTGTGPVVCTLPAGTVPGTYTLTYTTTVDADASGTVGNSVTGTGGGDPDPECTNCTTTHNVSLPEIASSKSSNPATGTTVNPGETITYTLSTTITTAALTQVYTLTDTLSGQQTFGSVTNAGAYTCTGTGPLVCTLQAGTAPGTYTLTYTATINANAAGTTVGNNVTGTGGGDPTPSCAPCATTHPVQANADLRSEKALAGNADEDGSGTVTAGDTLTYTVTVTNTGNVALTNLTVTDNKIAPNTTTCATVEPGQTCVLTGTYSVTQADANAGIVRNAAIVTAETPPGVPSPCTAGASDPKCNPKLDVPVIQAPGLKSVKTMDRNADEDGNGQVSVGDTLTYSITVTNTGNVTLTDVVVADAKIAPNTITCASVDPGRTCVLTGTYTVVQADVDAAGVVNTATVSTSTPNVCPAGSTEAVCKPTVTVPIQAQPAVAIVKVATLSVDNATKGVGNANDVISYAVRITNTGNITLHDMGTRDVLENYAPTELRCGTTTLVPGASTDCEVYTHTITREEANAGGTLDNVVTVTARYGSVGGGGQTSGTATATGTAIMAVEPEQASDLVVSKEARPQRVKIGDLVRYTVTVRNVGETDAIDATLVDTPPAGFSLVEGSLQVADRDGQGRLIGNSPVSVDGLDIQAGQSATVVYLLRVGASVRPGSHVNSAYAEDGGKRSNIATATVELVSDPLLDESLLLGTVFDDRDEDRWQDPADLSELRVQGGFAPGAYIANSTTVDRGDGARPEPDASSPMLHGIALGKIAGRQSDADPVAAHTVTISQLLREPSFTDDFVLTNAQGVTVRMDAAGNTRVERSGDAGKGLTGADPKVERRVAQAEGGYRVDYIVSNHGVDERGIPGVRLASVEGLLIETDQFGRYHLEGVAGGPWERGRNFVLKLDPATLPPGSKLTTDNPLVRRLTPGVPVRFDFGVKLPPGEIPGPKQDVELRIGEVFFDAGSAAVKPAYLPAVENMADKVRQYGGGEIVITANGDSEALAMDRALAVRKSLESLLAPEQIKALQISVRTDAQDPKTMVVGFAEWPKLGEVLFDTDKSTVKPKYLPLLKKIAAALEDLKGNRVVVVGHTDKRASDAYNIALGMRRAKAVYDAIAAHASPEVRKALRVDASNDPDAPAGKSEK